MTTRPEDRIKAALDLITETGGFDGSHHKMWTLDQVVRILTDCPTVTKNKTDPDGKPYTYEVLGESDEYRAWVTAYCDGEAYLWDEGIAP